MLEWAQTGALAGLFIIGYRHVMAAFKLTRTRDDALAKRLLSYEQGNAAAHERIESTAITRHVEVIQRLTHVEALVNGKPDGK